MFLVGHTVAMVAYCDKKMITMCSPTTGQFFVTVIVASRDKTVGIATHQNLSAANCFEPH